MKTVYQYIEFIEKAPKPKTRVWSVINRRSKHELGRVAWYSQWRRYGYYNTCEAWYTEECFNSISDFLKQADKEQEKRRAERRG